MLPTARIAPVLGRHCARSLSTRLTTQREDTPTDVLTKTGTGEVQATTLENGIRVVSVETYAPSSVVGLVVQAGSRYEVDQPYGTAHTLSRLALKSTFRTTSFRRTVEIENQCESFSAVAGREHLRFVGALPRANVADFVSTSLFDSLTFAAHEYELLEAEQTIREDVQQPLKNRLLSALYREAYDDRAIGRPVIPCGSWPLPTPDNVIDFIGTTHLPKRTAVVGVGVDHQQLVDLAREAWGSVGVVCSDEPVTFAASEYTGGRIRIIDPNSPSFVAIGFNGKGIKGSHLLAISKLFKSTEATAITGFCDVWSDASIAGLIVSNDEAEDQQTAVKLLRSLKTAPNEVLQTAITTAYAETACLLGTRKGTFEILAGHAFLPHQPSTTAILESLEKLTPDELRASLSTLLASPPTIASIGQADNIIRSI